MASRPNFEQEHDDDSALVADVFGIDLGGDDNSSPQGDASVGTEGDAGGEDVPASEPPASTPPASEPSPPVQEPAPAAPAAPAAPQPAAPPAPQAAPNPLEMENASLRARMEALEALIAQQQAPQPEGTPRAAGQPGQGQGPQVIPVQLPRQMLDSIYSDDPQQAEQALNGLLTMVATGLNARFEARLAQVEQGVMQRFEGQVQERTHVELQEEAKRNRDAYFAAFPHHNKPVLMATLAQEADQLASEFPGIPWDEKFTAALGQRVEAKLQEAGFVMQGVPAQQPAVAQAPSRPAAMMPTAARPAPSDGDVDIIAETFSFT
jgi:hypothetical protein